MKRVFFSFFTLLISFILIGVFILVPKAQAACTSNPSWQILGHSDGPRYVTYHLRLINNCAGSNTFRIRVSGLPTAPQRLHADWRVKKNNGDWGDLNTMVTRTVNGSQNIDVRVIRDVNYYHPDQVYRYVNVRAALDSNTSVNSTISDLVYIVVNKPDLIVSKFIFPGGPTCKTTDATVRIRNQGWRAFSGDFDVRVFNGNGNNGRTFRVTQFVDAREFINLDSRFRNINLPPVGNWTAKAVVDLNNNISEEVENNNEEKDKYNTTTCVTPPPTNPPATPTTPPTTPTTPPTTPTVAPTVTPGGYTISGGVYNDANESRNKDTLENYIAGNIRITNSSGTIVDTPTSIAGTGFISNRLPAGRYTISYIDTVPPESTITYPTVLPASITMNLGPTCVDDIPGDPTCSGSNIINVNFGIYTPLTTATPWIHGFGGDMRVDRGMSNIIPDGFYFSEVFSTPSNLPYMDAGVVFGGSGLDLGDPIDEKANVNEWLVNSPYGFPKVNSSYSSMYDILNKGGALRAAAPLHSQACIAPNPPNCTLDPGLPGGIYIADRFESVTLNPSIGDSYVFESGQNYIFLIYEDLIINTNISVPKGSTVMFIVKGNITVSENVERIDGIYSTENDFTVEGNPTGTDQQLNINGSVIANAGLNQYRGETPGEFINERDLGDRNELEPAVEFSFRPDFILNMPKFIRYKNYTIREVAPGSKSQP